MSLDAGMKTGDFERALGELRELQVDSNLTSREARAFFETAHSDVPVRAIERPAGAWWRIPAWMAVAATAAALIMWRVAERAPAAEMAVEDADPSVAPAAMPDRFTEDAPVVELGERVGAVAAAESIYVVDAVTPLATHVRVKSGAVTVRLFHDSQAAHELVVRAEDYSFVARGTIYTVQKSARGASVVVHEGQVWVRDRQGAVLATLGQGEVWPNGAAVLPETESAAKTLARHSLASTARLTTEKAPSKERISSPKVDPDTPSDQWQRARLLRAQSKPTEAIAVLEALAASGDVTWAPLALIEQIRIHRDLSSDSPEVVRLGQQFAARYPDHPLFREVTSLVCPVDRRLNTTPSLAVCRMRLRP